MTRQRTRCCRTGRAISGPKTGEQFVGVAKLNVIYAARPTDDRLQPGGAVPVRVGRHWLYRAECLSLLRLRGARQRLSRRAGLSRGCENSAISGAVCHLRADRGHSRD